MVSLKPESTAAVAVEQASFSPPMMATDDGAETSAAAVVPPPDLGLAIFFFLRELGVFPGGLVLLLVYAENEGNVLASTLQVKKQSGTAVAGGHDGVIGGRFIRARSTYGTYFPGVHDRIHVGQARTMNLKCAETIRLTGVSRTWMVYICMKGSFHMNFRERGRYFPKGQDV